ncbi:hypothetical protein ACHAW6_009637 [Cyclotella cf. meneghiniana]
MIVLHLLITMLITTQRIAAFGTTRLQISKSRHKVVPFASDLTKLHSTNSGSQPIHYYIYTQLDDNVGNLPCRRDLQHVLATIEKAAYSAGEVTLATAGKIAIKATKANIRDLVTESDFQCQALIKEIIMSEFPGDFFLGEEDVDMRDVGGKEMTTSESLTKALGVAIPKDDGDDCLLFVVDPIDGTVSKVLSDDVFADLTNQRRYCHMSLRFIKTNFQAGLPLYAISIGVISLAGNHPEVVAGVIYNPTLAEMTSAVRGRGCYLNNQRIKHHTQEQHEPRKSILNQSLINVGFPIAKESTLLASSRAVTALATKVRGLRMIASASQTMAWVAQCKLNAYFSWDLNAWDVCAGMVIVEESGGLVSNFDGTRADISSRDMIITCCAQRGEEGLLRDELITVMAENNCMGY